MELSSLLRYNILSNIKEYIVDNISNPLINFYSPTELICSVPFDGMIPQNSYGTKAAYLFTKNDAPFLRNIVSASGTVQNFKISGLIPGYSQDDNFIIGTVGAYSSGSDIKFNKINWVEGMNITLTNLVLVMK